MLLLPAPAFIAWALFGALAAPSPVRRYGGALARARAGGSSLAVLVVGAGAVLRSATQLAAMAVFSEARTTAQFERAARLDRASYRIRMRLADAVRGARRL